MTNAIAVWRTRLEWIDTDAAGIYHNSAVVRFVEAAEAAMMRERGVHGYYGAAPRVRYEVDFAAPLVFDQEVTTVLTLARIGTTSMTFEFEVWGEEWQGRPRTRAASGRFVTVHVPGGHRADASSAPWPGEWVKALTDGSDPAQCSG